MHFSVSFYFEKVRIHTYVKARHFQSKFCYFLRVSYMLFFLFFVVVVFFLIFFGEGEIYEITSIISSSKFSNQILNAFIRVRYVT